MMSAWKNKRGFLLFLIGLISCIAYYFFAYHYVRTDLAQLGILYTVLFGLFFLLVHYFKDDFKSLTLLAILFRVTLIVAIPNLSQDFYRFIWDGRMILEGLNPYLYTPGSFIDIGKYPIHQAHELFQGMGHLSAGNHTNYPPLNQLCFVIAGLFSGSSISGAVIVMRVLIIIADVGTLLVGKKLLKSLQIPTSRIFWYILNPFVIIELTGNLHFESVMIFFLILSLYLLHKSKWKMAALVLAISISIKLIPLIFLPLFFKKLGFKKWILFCAIVGFTSVLLFAPFLSIEFVHNYTNTVALWFQKFEFNASIYYLIREIGYSYRGYNEIATIGKILSFTVLLFVLLAAFSKKNETTKGLIICMLFVLVSYFFTTTTMHPWYLATPLFLSLFTRYKFTLVWSLVIFLSYYTYANDSNINSYWVLLIEYGIVYSVFFYEVFSTSTCIKKNLT